VERKEIKTGWKFDNSYARLPEIFYTKIRPAPVRSPELIIFNRKLAESLGLKVNELESNEGAKIFAGNMIPEGSEPLAQAYAGHQFGYFTMLGDGRAVLLGEQITPSGQRYDIQLKGSGRTPYSRGGDGRAALGPMLREYIISESMYNLGIPTTRSLAVAATGEPVYRETALKGSVLTRLASSHLRVGTFQYAANWGTAEDLRALADYAVNRHFPELLNEDERYRLLLREIIKRQALLISKWQLVGFIHGVMNTDNMTISGETIDYGPCAFMDDYNPETVFSSIDTYGRYSYKNQPGIGEWNLARLAETLLPLLSENKELAVKIAQEEIPEYNKIYQNNWINGMRSKLGLLNEEPGDEELIENLLTIMQKYHADYTNTFVSLTFDKYDESEMFKSSEFKEWHNLWQAKISRQDDTKGSSYKLMRSSNPAIVPRNHRVEEALAAADNGDYSVMERLLNVLARPFEHLPEQAEYAVLPAPDLSCPYRTFCGT